MALAKETIGNYEGTSSTVDLPGRVEVLGAPVDPWTMGQTVEATDALIKEGRFAHLMADHHTFLCLEKHIDYLYVRTCTFN